MSKEALFTFDHGRFIPTSWSRGPWDAGLLHGGPSAALLAHGLEKACDDPTLLVTRMTIDLLRPVRLAPLRVTTQVVREGKRIKLVDAFLLDGDTVVARASGLMLRRKSNDPLPDPACNSNLPDWRGSQPYDFGTSCEIQAFHCATEFREIPRDESRDAFALWIRVPFLLLPDQPLSPLERAAATSDYVNGVGSYANAKPGFINADITLNLHREPFGEWLCMESVGRPDLAGIATSVATLYDETGMLGSASCCCLANQVAQRFGARSCIEE